MSAIVRIFDTLLVYNISVIIVIAFFNLCNCYRDDDKRFTSKKLDNIFERYMTAIKRLSGDFPNHQIELHLDIARTDPQKQPRRVNYIHLREPKPPTVRTDGKDKTERNHISKPMSLPLIDPEMQPVFMKDLKKAIDDEDRKYGGKIDADDSYRKSNVDGNMRPILELLEKGTLVNSEIKKPPEENMSWLEIKIPK